MRHDDGLEGYFQQSASKRMMMEKENNVGRAGSGSTSPFNNSSSSSSLLLAKARSAASGGRFSAPQGLLKWGERFDDFFLISPWLASDQAKAAERKGLAERVQKQIDNPTAWSALLQHVSSMHGRDPSSTEAMVRLYRRAMKSIPPVSNDRPENAGSEAYVNIYLGYAREQSRSGDLKGAELTLRQMRNLKIGLRSASFYRAWAKSEADAGRLQKAREALSVGSRCAQIHRRQELIDLNAKEDADLLETLISTDLVQSPTEPSRTNILATPSTRRVEESVVLTSNNMADDEASVDSTSSRSTPAARSARWTAASYSYITSWKPGVPLKSATAAPKQASPKKFVDRRPAQQQQRQQQLIVPQQTPAAAPPQQHAIQREHQQQQQQAQRGGANSSNKNLHSNRLGDESSSSSSDEEEGGKRTAHRRVPQSSSSNRPTPSAGSSSSSSGRGVAAEDENNTTHGYTSNQLLVPLHESSMENQFLSLVEPRNVVRVEGEQYARLALIGRGGSSKVFRVLDTQGRIMALKRVRLKGTDARDSLAGYANEITLLRRLCGKPGIISLHAAEIDEIGGSISIVMEAGDADLATVLARRREAAVDGFPPLSHVNFVRLAWQQMLEAVDTIHEERIIHGDLKPANFLFVQGKLQLIDFGIARAIKNDTTNIYRDAQIGTLNYMSPEAILDTNVGNAKSVASSRLGGVQQRKAPAPRRKQTMRVGRASDVWSLGCILYQMIYGRTPFGHLHLYAKLQAICNPAHEIDLPDAPLASDDALDCLRGCLQRDPTARPPIAGKESLLTHRYLEPRLEDSLPTRNQLRIALQTTFETLPSQARQDPTALADALHASLLAVREDDDLLTQAAELPDPPSPVVPRPQRKKNRRRSIVDRSDRRMLPLAEEASGSSPSNAPRPSG